MADLRVLRLLTLSLFLRERYVASQQGDRGMISGGSIECSAILCVGLRVTALLSLQVFVLTLSTSQDVVRLLTYSFQGVDFVENADWEFRLEAWF